MRDPFMAMTRILKFIGIVQIGLQSLGTYGWAQEPQVFMTDGEIRESIQSALSVRHPVDRADYWRSLGANAPDVIIAMYKEEKNMYKRIRLVDALAWYDSQNATYFLKQESESADHSVIRRAALKALAIAQGASEEEFITRALDRGPASTRSAVEKALLRRNDRSAQELGKRLGRRTESAAQSSINSENSESKLEKNRARIVR